MEMALVWLGQLMEIVSQCPSGKYCLRALRVDCGACPYRPGTGLTPPEGVKPSDR